MRGLQGEGLKSIGPRWTLRPMHTHDLLMVHMMEDTRKPPCTHPSLVNIHDNQGICKYNKNQLVYVPNGCHLLYIQKQSFYLKNFIIVIINIIIEIHKLYKTLELYEQVKIFFKTSTYIFREF